MVMGTVAPVPHSSIDFHGDRRAARSLKKKQCSLPALTALHPTMLPLSFLTLHFVSRMPPTAPRSTCTLVTFPSLQLIARLLALFLPLLLPLPSRSLTCLFKLLLLPPFFPPYPCPEANSACDVSRY